MLSRSPHYILYTEATPCEAVPCSAAPFKSAPLAERSVGQWRFILEAVDGNGPVDSGRVEHSDVETEVERERLELLSLVRGLEALDQPSRVTLVTKSRYVRLGLTYVVGHARVAAPAPGATIRNSDLWQRVAQALTFHKLDCRMWRLDGPHRRPLGVPRRYLAPAERLTSWWRGSRLGCRLREAIGGCVRRLGLA